MRPDILKIHLSALNSAFGVSAQPGFCGKEQVIVVGQRDHDFLAHNDVRNEIQFGDQTLRISLSPRTP